jgi:hypothetical protein
MIKWTLGLLGSLCIMTALFDFALRAYEALTPVQISMGSGAFAAILLTAPLFMRVSDTDLSNIGVAEVEEI